MASFLMVLWCLFSLCFGDNAEQTVFSPNERLSAAVLEVPLVQQVGERNNCGPSAVAMLLGAYQGHRGADLERLRDRIGDWSWSKFPLRRLRVPGRGAGLTTASMIRASLERFGGALSFDDHRSLADLSRAQAFDNLQVWLGDERPVLVLVASGPLWEQSIIGLHWIVVIGIRDQMIVFNDPADSRQEAISIPQFMEAWRIGSPLTGLPSVESYTAFVAGQSLPSQTRNDPLPGTRITLR